MKQLSITWDVPDSTGYLFSLAKSLACAVKNSPWAEVAEDIVATSGFAFRMWVSADLCPSATSIWDFDGQQAWVESGGLTCSYVGRAWGEDAIEQARQLEAITTVKASIDAGVPAVSWDIGVPEWGLITGYDDQSQVLFVQPVNDNAPVEMAYALLGKRDIPILSVLTVTGKTDKSPEMILKDTMALAVSHLRGEEWCDNAKGLEAYPKLIDIFKENPELASGWNAEYFLGTYGALKWYAWKYFEKAGQVELTEIYRRVYDAWMEAFALKTGPDAGQAEVREKIATLLAQAHAAEMQAVAVMAALLG